MTFALIDGVSGIWVALWASLFLGVCCGLPGAFVVVRRIALFGDALSHAVFPGVVGGFWLFDFLEKTLPAESWWVGEAAKAALVLVCALGAGLLGSGVVTVLRSTTKLKQDACLGIVLATFFAVGLGMHSKTQSAGVANFLFGSMGAIGESDLILMGIVAVLMVVVIVALQRPLYVASFDAGFARNLGYRVKLLERLFSLLLTLAIVVSIQAVGVILVSAVLIIPAATAYLLTDRFSRMMWLSVLFGVLTGVGGCLISYQVENAGTGPVMALLAAFFFGLCFLLAPQYGLLARLFERRQQGQRIGRENVLKGIFHLLEAEGQGRGREVSLEEYAAWRGLELPQARAGFMKIVKAGDAEWVADSGGVILTGQGYGRAADVVRNHRLWELYLTREADYAADHVHDDAEKIEHLLGEETVRELERELGYPTEDPHGKRIPGLSSGG